MTRPAGVTAAAVVALLGSALTLLFGALMVFAAFTGVDQQQNVRGIGLASAAVAAAFAGLGIATAIGLFRLREWARISMVVFGALMTGMCGLTMIVMAFVPLPPNPAAPISISTLRAILIGIYSVPALIGVWWLVEFNRAATKAAFASATGGEPSRRPLSVAIIGWWMLIGGIVTVIPALIGMPALVAGVILKGWSARLMYFFFAAVSVYIGWGLLKLQERARLVALAWFGLTTAHVAYVTLSPQARGQMREAQALFQADFGLPRTSNVPVAFGDMTTFTIAVMVISVLIVGAMMWFLVRNKAAFQQPEAS